jgi:hypothetical protein
MSKVRLMSMVAGGHSRLVAEATELSGQFEVVVLLDDSLPVGENVLA